jgi:predicted nucleic acid-binding Zn ribbon protein
MDQLTKDSISAQKAGMSYGQYMALKPKKACSPKLEIEDDFQYCAVCGEAVDGRKGKKYCSPRCYEEAMQAKARERYRKKVAQCG